MGCLTGEKLVKDVRCMAYNSLPTEQHQQQQQPGVKAKYIFSTVRLGWNKSKKK